METQRYDFSLIAFRNGQIAMGVRRINVSAENNYEKIYVDYMGNLSAFVWIAQKEATRQLRCLLSKGAREYASSQELVNNVKNSRNLTLNVPHNHCHGDPAGVCDYHYIILGRTIYIIHAHVIQPYYIYSSNHPLMKQFYDAPAGRALRHRGAIVMNVLWGMRRVEWWLVEFGV